jgi:hypothetical protein
MSEFYLIKLVLFYFINGRGERIGYTSFHSPESRECDDKLRRI